MEFLYMYIHSKVLRQFPTLSSNSPTDTQRHEILYNSLIKAGRPEDYDNIVSLLSPPPDITRYASPGEFKNIKVGIIGGGLSGMSAAFELRNLGFDITIFEPITDRVGGRVYTYYFDNDKRLYGELGAMRIPVAHETTWRYINLFKLNTEPFVQYNPNTFTYVRDVRERNDPNGENIFHKIYPKFDLSIQEANTPWPKLYNQVSKYYLSTLPPEIRKQFLMIMPKYDYRYELLDNMSTRQALQKYGLSEEAINLIGSVLPAVGAVFHHSYEATLADEYSMDFLNVYQISGGMSNLPLAFYKSLTSPNPPEYSGIQQSDLGKALWKGGYYVTGIFQSDTDSKVTLSYTNVNDSTRSFETFDYVVSAVPLPVLREFTIRPLFRGRKMQAIKELFHEDAQKTLSLCRERFWEKQGISGGISYTDEVIETIHYPQDHTNCTKSSVSCSPDEPGVLLASYNISQDALGLGNIDPVQQYQIIQKNVEMVHGLPEGYLNNIVMNHITIDWTRASWFYGAFQMYLPGQKKDFSYVSTTPEYDNRIFFAGEHASRKNAWIQGALRSGMIAANDVAFYSVIHKHQK